MENSPAYRGYFINLDRATARRQKMEAQFDKYGLSETYTRFSAVDRQQSPKRAGGRTLTDGETAIFQSHVGVLKAASVFGSYAHVLEDDVILSASLQPFMAFALKLGLFSIFDIVFLDTYVNPHTVALKTYRTAAAKAFAVSPARPAPSDFGLLDIQLYYYLGMMSYVVNPASFERIRAILEAEWDRGPSIPVDHLLRREILAGRLRAGCVLPFVTSIGLDEALESQSGRRDDLDTAVGHALLQKSFFVERDLAMLDTLANRLVARTVEKNPRDEHALLLRKLLGSFAL